MVFSVGSNLCGDRPFVPSKRWVVSMLSVLPIRGTQISPKSPRIILPFLSSGLFIHIAALHFLCSHPILHDSMPHPTS
jgi:hypothetical protein